MSKEIFIVRNRITFYKQLCWTVQRQLYTAIHFLKMFRKILMLESSFWTNYRLAVQSSHHILK